MSRARVLVVEDDADSRELLRQVLQLDGHEVATAANGWEALEVLRAGPLPDLVVLDMMMPVLSGWQLLDERARDPRLAAMPVLVVTASGDSESALAHGATGWLRKPLDADTFLGEVDRLACRERGRG